MRTLLLVAALVSSAGALAQSQASADSSKDKPWAKGVTEENKQKALEAFRQGNLMLRDSVFVQAAARYREALTYWDHPAIHYNLVLALLNLDQPVEVLEHVDAAMRYGPAGLDNDKFEQARAYKVIFAKQVAQVDVRCEIAGAQVVMDGRPLFTAPGRHQGLVRAGPHTIVATREGYLTNELSQEFPAGQTTELSIKLYTADQLTRYRQKMPGWIPWVTLGAGVAIAGGGAGLHSMALGEFRQYDAAIQDCGGCVPNAVVNGHLSTGNLAQDVAIGSYIAGGALLTTGAVLAFINRPEPYRISPAEYERGAGAKASAVLSPVFAPGYAALSLAGTF